MAPHSDGKREDACDVNNNRRCPGEAFERARAGQPGANDANDNTASRVDKHPVATLPETHRDLPLSHRVYENIVDEQPRLLPGGRMPGRELAD